MTVQVGLEQTPEQAVAAVEQLLRQQRGQVIAITDMKAGGVKAGGVLTALDLALGLDPNWRTYHVSIPFDDPTAGSHALGEHLFQQERYDVPRVVLVETSDPVDYAEPFRLVLGTVKQRPDVAFVVQLTPTRRQLQFLVPLLGGLVEIEGGPGDSAITRRIPDLIRDLRLGLPISVRSTEESQDGRPPLLEQIPRPEWPELIGPGHANYNGTYSELRVRVVKRTVEGHLILNLLDSHIDHFLESTGRDLAQRAELSLIVSTTPKNFDGATGVLQRKRSATNVLAVAPSEFTYHTLPGRTLTMYELREGRPNARRFEVLPQWLYLAVR